MTEEQQEAARAIRERLNADRELALKIKLDSLSAAARPSPVARRYEEAMRQRALPLFGDDPDTVAKDMASENARMRKSLKSQKHIVREYLERMSFDQNAFADHLTRARGGQAPFSAASSSGVGLGLFYVDQPYWGVEVSFLEGYAHTPVNYPHTQVSAPGNNRFSADLQTGRAKDATLSARMTCTYYAMSAGNDQLSWVQVPVWVGGWAVTALGAELGIERFSIVAVVTTVTAFTVNPDGTSAMMTSSPKNRIYQEQIRSALAPWPAQEQNILYGWDTQFLYPYMQLYVGAAIFVTLDVVCTVITSDPHGLAALDMPDVKGAIVSPGIWGFTEIAVP
ncbi:MAG TPA: hypothetical protein VH349_09785 [Ktedonobacterales bacterium]